MKRKRMIKGKVLSLLCAAALSGSLLAGGGRSVLAEDAASPEEVTEESLQEE